MKHEELVNSLKNLIAKFSCEEYVSILSSSSLIDSEKYNKYLNGCKNSKSWKEIDNKGIIFIYSNKEYNFPILKAILIRPDANEIEPYLLFHLENELITIQRKLIDNLKAEDKQKFINELLENFSK